MFIYFKKLKLNNIKIFLSFFIFFQNINYYLYKNNYLLLIKKSFNKYNNADISGIFTNSLKKTFIVIFLDKIS